MKIYFAGSIRGGREDVLLYLDIINFLKKYGTVSTEHIGDLALESIGENKNTDIFIHNRDVKWLLDSDFMVAEVSNPSLGVGYEIGIAIGQKKRILCLYKKGSTNKLSAMIAGSKDIVLIKYSNLKSLKIELTKKLSFLN